MSTAASRWSVCTDLVVWCGRSYVWWAGGNSARSGRRLYLSCPLDAPHAAAQLVAARYQRLRVSRPSPATIGDVPRAGTGSGPGGGVAACRGVPATGREMR